MVNRHIQRVVGAPRTRVGQAFSSTFAQRYHCFSHNLRNASNMLEPSSRKPRRRTRHGRKGDASHCYHLCQNGNGGTTVVVVVVVVVVVGRVNSDYTSGCIQLDYS
jgi:hypothetical protein